MSSAGISFGGLASGLDTKAIISALVSIERRPIATLEQTRSRVNRQKSLFGDLSGLLDKLSETAKSLKRTTDFLSMKAVSDDETVLTASASSSATPGTYSARVVALAKAQVNSTTGSASPNANLGGPATLQLDVGGNTFLIAVNDPSLESIAAAINAQDEQSDTGVRAEVIDTGNTANGGANRYQLVVRSEQPGAANGFSISVDDGDPAFAAVVNDLAANERVAASDAQLLVNGAITVFRSTNTISDLFPGITLDLRSVSAPNEDVTVTVSTDGAETGKKVKEFVDAYNAVVDFFTTQNALDSEGNARSPLFGDPTLRSMRSNLRQIVGDAVTSTGNESYQLLAQIGVTADTQGKLTFNQTRFEEALADDETAVAALFTDATNGIASQLETKIELYTDSVDGLIKARNDGFDRLVKQTQTRIEQAERRLTLYEQQLEVRYANLESLLARLQGQGSSVGNIAQRN